MRRSPSSGGFTLLEILIVIVIISILSSLLLYGVHAAIQAARQSSTEGVVRSISGALESYKSQYGDYPPSSLDRFRVRLPNDTNNGIETLVACISTTKKGGPFWRPQDENQFINADKDKADRNLTNWYFGHNELMEVSDNFGNTLWYLHSADYAKPAPHHLKVIPYLSAKPVTLKVYQSDKLKTPANPGRFQLVSAGPDGIFGTMDDIRGW